MALGPGLRQPQTGPGLLCYCLMYTLATELSSSSSSSQLSGCGVYLTAISGHRTLLYHPRACGIQLTYLRVCLWGMGGREGRGGGRGGGMHPASTELTARRMKERYTINHPQPLPPYPLPPPFAIILPTTNHPPTHPPTTHPPTRKAPFPHGL